MFQRVFARSNLAAVALSGLLLLPHPAAAQQGQHLYEWSGHWGRFSEGAAYPGGYGVEYAAPAYVYPPVSYYTVPNPSLSGTATEYQYGYFGPSSAGQPSTINREVLINVSVPATAEIWIEGKKTTQGGLFRQFISPPLTPGRDYSYDIKARWRDNGKEVTRTRHVNVHAGGVVDVSFGSRTGSVNDTRYGLRTMDYARIIMAATHAKWLDWLVTALVLAAIGAGLWYAHAHGHLAPAEAWVRHEQCPRSTSCSSEGNGVGAWGLLTPAALWMAVRWT